MKPEIGYPKIVIGSYIDDLLTDIEWNMKHCSPKDPYFEQLSIEKFALSAMLEEISKRDDISPAAIVEEFSERMAKYDSIGITGVDVFAGSRDAALSILDGLYSGFMEGEIRSGFEPQRPLE